MAGPLKLRAADEEDLAVISAVLQDALVAIGDMSFLAEEGRFVLVANRFRWEVRPEDRGNHFERTLAGLAFDGVEAVKTRGFDPRDHDRILQVLAIHREEDAIVFAFSGDAGLRLQTRAIHCQVEDLGEPWPTHWRPRHPLDAG
ncbi:MAG: DUF2948 family protein [Alphaproteobacteria bacterium]|nr:DUF2948 family protein [Alphaproteobacteria bacterium]